jgi:uncharacterized protein (UPF0332 family)
MSPRSQEFMASACERLAGARDAFAAGHLDLAVSAAYYAMLYAARAALSEDDEHARTHGGTWNLFRSRYVVTDAFDQQLFARAHSAQSTREQSDYEAIMPESDRAEAVVADAAEFIAAIERMLAG